VLVEGALHWADNGRVICAKCAGQSALYSGRDISGQKVERISVAEVRAWPTDLGALRCSDGCTTLAALAGSDGWPIPRGDVW